MSDSALPQLSADFPPLEVEVLCSHHEGVDFTEGVEAMADSQAVQPDEAVADDHPAPRVPGPSDVPTGGCAPEAVFRKLVAEYGRPLYYFILRRVRHETDAEDLAQQAFVEAAASYGRFRGEAELSTWLFGIATNLTRNHLSRSPSRRHQFEGTEMLEEFEAPQPGPCDQLILSESVRQLHLAISALPKGSADALILVSVDGLSYEDAARQLGVPVGTVRSRVSRARAEVRQKLRSVRIITD